MSENNKQVFPPATRESAKKKADMAPEQIEAWRNFSKEVFKDGDLDSKTKQLIAVAVAHVTQCPYCIKAHTKGSKKAGATNDEIMEAVWIAAEMRAGAAYAHSNIALEEIETIDNKN